MDEENTTFFKHESAYVDDPAVIGKGTKIWHFSHVMAGVEVGEDCVLGQNVYVGKGAKIGRNVHIQNGVSLYEGVVLEDDVFCGPSMVFTNVINPRSHISRKHEIRQTIVRHGASIGANATIVCGYTIGAHAFIGAGTVVSRDVPEYALVIGVPGTIRGWVCKCSDALLFQPNGEIETAQCQACGVEYRKRGEAVGPIDTG